MAIVPDDKDWTWVLTRPCSECGFDSSAVESSALPSRIREAVLAWQQVLGRKDITARTREDRWSALEYGCHVRDVFLIFDERLALMLRDDGASFANWDQDATAVESRYDLQDPVRVSAELAAAGAVLAARYEEVSGAQWERRGYRSNGSAFTVETLGRYMIHDPFHHLWDVSTL
jgi:hypothetical protein